MFCPKCRTEYREGFTHCVDCDADLVPELLDKPEELPLEETNHDGFWGFLTRRIDWLLKIGGVVVAAIGVLKVLLAVIPALSRPDLNSGFIPSILGSLPADLVQGLGYFGLGELIRILRLGAKGGEEIGKL